MLNNGMADDWPKKHRDMLIATDVLAAISGFLSIWLGVSINSQKNKEEE